MSRAKRIALWSAILIVLVTAAGAAKVTRDEAHKLLTNPRAGTADGARNGYPMRAGASRQAGRA